MRLRSGGQRARGGAVLIALLLAACDGGGDDGVPHTGEPSGPEWSVIGDTSNLPAAAVLSLAGTSTDLWAVGADDGQGPVVLHWDGSAWARLDTGTSGDLWWIWSGGGDLVHFGGAGGRVVTHDRSTGAFTEVVAASPSHTVFGLWGTSDDDLYAAAGDVNNGSDGEVLHFDGAAWSLVATAPPSDDGLSRRQAFKVWGSASDDVFVVGTGALVMHFDGATWTTAPPPVPPSTQLTTVSGTSGTDVWAVGGYGNGRAAHFDGATWTDLSPNPMTGGAIVPGINGVFASADHGTVVCGENGAVWWVEADGTWTEDERGPASGGAFHACTIDETGAVWAVGGDLTTLTEGLIVRSEPGIPPFDD